MSWLNEFAGVLTPGFSLCYAKAPRTFDQAPNLIAPRVAFELMSSEWSPGTRLSKMNAPLLVVAPSDDDLIPFRITENVVENAGGSE